MLVFSHIPRTGGTSLRSFISARVKRSGSLDALSDLAFRSDAELMGYEFLATHCGHAVFSRLPRARRITVLRNPIERIVSMYHHLRELADDVSYASHYAKSLNLRDFVSQTNPAVSVGVENAQLWHLVHDKNLVFRQKYRGLTDREKIDMALTNLSTYAFVGFYDQLDALFATIDKSLGPSNLERPWLASSQRPRLSDLDEKDLEAVRAKVSLDEQLFVEARSRFG